MYLPYLRGKQYELIALRDAADIVANSKVISPIIEPVKRAQTTLFKTLDLYKSKNLNFTLIANPRVGEFKGSQIDLINDLNDYLKGYNNFQYGVILDGRFKVSHIEAFLEKHVPKNVVLNLVHLQPTDATALEGLAKKYTVRLNLIHGNITDRHYNKKLKFAPCARLDNPFNAQEKNADYANAIDELFTMEHNYFEEDGYEGFSDYLTIGDDFQEGGFLPYAVAFHLTYQKGDEIRVRHFVSDSNFDNTDVPGKFAEALDKFYEFNKTAKLKTRGANELEQYHSEGHFPGLGVLKKISVLNHIELISNCLS